MDHVRMYQDSLTKLRVLRPVKSQRPTEAAAQLIDIFPLSGSILQSDNGTEFTAHVILESKDFWPALVMVHAKPLIRNVRDLVAWLAENDKHDWVTCRHQVCIVPEDLCSSFRDKMLSMLSFVW